MLISCCVLINDRFGNLHYLVLKFKELQIIKWKSVSICFQIQCFSNIIQFISDFIEFSSYFQTKRCKSFRIIEANKDAKIWNSRYILNIFRINKILFFRYFIIPQKVKGRRHMISRKSKTFPHKITTLLLQFKENQLKKSFLAPISTHITQLT